MKEMFYLLWVTGECSNYWTLPENPVTYYIFIRNMRRNEN